MPRTVPFPPSNAMPPIRQAVTAESRSVSNPSGVALPSRTDETAPARPGQRPGKREGNHHGTDDGHAGGSSLRPAPADREDLAPPDGVAKEQVRDEEDNEHQDAERRQQTPRTRWARKSVSPNRGIGMVTLFSLLMIIANPLRPISVPIVKTSELIPVTAMTNPWSAPKAQATATRDRNGGNHAHSGDDQVDCEHADNRRQRAHGQVELSRDHGNADAERREPNEDRAVQQGRRASDRVVGRQHGGEDDVDSHHEGRANREIGEGLPRVHACLFCKR